MGMSFGAFDVVFDGRGAIAAAGVRVAALAGLAAGALVGRPLSELFRGPALQLAFGVVGPLELKVAGKAAIAGSGVRVADGEGFILTFLPDLAVGVAAPAATKLHDPEPRLATEVVREVNDGLTGILGFAGLAQLAPTPHRRKYCLEQVAIQAERVRRLVGALDPAASQPTALTGPVDLAVEVPRALAGTRLALEQHGVAFELQTPAAAWARCDGRLVADLVVTLALRATTDKRREYQANEVTVSVEPAGGQVRVVLLLTGADNPSSLMREEFGQGEVPATLGTSEAELRAGLTALVRQGGSFEVIRDPELESVRLVVSVPSSAEGKKRDELRTPVPLEILAIDDDAVLGELYPELLAVTGHNVVTVRSIEAAREMLRAQRFDAVLSEFTLRDGLLPELWATAAEAHPELKSRLIVVTRDPRHPRLIEWLRESQAPVLAKPFQFHALVDQVALLST